MKEPLLSYTQQNFPPQIPLVTLKDACLGGMMKMSASKDFFYTKTVSSSEAEVGTDARKDRPSVVSVCFCILYLCICESGMHSPLSQF